ncbi:unnamed protein product [Owenia fusiformis]|uniref:EGF-like domain-containing protein n=1 Tax=Owenia fusiformis TaxID=6347 RepID=A0A8S4Q8Z9_OWEFU|nr:unnamed protein product [Owenia fusiformis]
MAVIMVAIISLLWSTVASTSPSAMLYIGGETRQLYNNFTLGVYTLVVDASNQTQHFNGKPSYRHETGSLFLYYMPSLMDGPSWRIGDTIGDSATYVKIEQTVELPELITEPLYTWSGSDWIVMDGISIVPFNEGKNTCRHLKLSGIENSNMNGIYENRNMTNRHRPSYYHMVLAGYYLYYTSYRRRWLVDSDFNDTAYFAYSAANWRLHPVSTNPWVVSIATWKQQQNVVLNCLDGNIQCSYILLSGIVETPSINGLYENNNKIIANMSTYTKQSNTAYHIYFVMSTGSMGKWVIDTDFVSTHYPASSNTIDIGTGVENNPTAASYWVALGDAEWVTQENSKWSCVDDIDDCHHSLCKNSGSCIDGVDSYSCNCVAGYTGSLCESELNECLSSPCQNGECNDAFNNYICTCREGFTGRHCEKDINECESNPCLNEGNCIDRENGYECNCVPGYTGTKCETGTYISAINI